MEERVGGPFSLELGQGPLPLRRDGQEPVGALAVGRLGEAVLGELEELGPRGLRPGQELRLVFTRNQSGA